MKKKYKIGDTPDVKIEKIVPKGLGLAFAENLTIFVPLAVAGDQLRVKINQTKGKTAFAEILEIIKPSKERQTPPCVYFGACGGCDFQQMNYETQLAAKVGIIRDCLRRIGKIEYEKDIPIIASPRPLNYRARAQWHLDPRRKKIGYYRRNSHDVIDVLSCPILVPELNDTLSKIRESINWKDFSGKTVEIEAASGGGKVSVFSTEILEPTAEVSFAVGGEKYFYSSKSFFQGNPFLIEDLLRLALENAAGVAALDLYCGVGLFTLPLARKFQTVVGVEANPQAVEFAEKSAEHARLENIKFYSEPVADFLIENESKKIDFVLLDPPRAGAEKQTIENIIKLNPKQISYVSCEPAVLARDLRLFLNANFQIRSITALDLFPQTHHVETIVCLES